MRSTRSCRKRATMWRGSSRLRDLAIPIGFVILLLILWETGFRREWWNSYLFPGPSEVLKTLTADMRDGSLPIAIRVSLVRIAIGFGTAMAIGLTTGILMGTLPLVHRA